MELLINGGLVDLDDLQEDDINTVPIALALSRINRFMGNFNSISVAQHAVVVSNVIEGLGGTLIEQMSGLHHDDAEALIGDIPSQVKKECIGFVVIEDAILDVIDSKYRCDTRSDIVKKADIITGNSELMFHIETDPSMPRMMAAIKDTDLGNGMMITAKMLVPWPREEAFAYYLDRHDKLMRGLVKEQKSLDDLSQPKSLSKAVN